LHGDQGIGWRFEVRCVELANLCPRVHQQNQRHPAFLFRDTNVAFAPQDAPWRDSKINPCPPTPDPLSFMSLFLCSNSHLLHQQLLQKYGLPLHLHLLERKCNPITTTTTQHHCTSKPSPPPPITTATTTTTHQNHHHHPNNPITTTTTQKPTLHPAPGRTRGKKTITHYVFNCRTGCDSTTASICVSTALPCDRSCTCWKASVVTHPPNPKPLRT